jgi:hypothetical protein
VLLEPRLHRPPRGKTHGAAPTATAAAAAAAAAAVLAQVKGEASVVHTASQTSTPRRESCLAIASFSGVLSVAPGDCSPSRRVVSKMVSFSRASAPPPAAAAAESARTPVACPPPHPQPPTPRAPTCAAQRSSSHATTRLVLGAPATHASVLRADGGGWRASRMHTAAGVVPRWDRRYPHLVVQERAGPLQQRPQAGSHHRGATRRNRAGGRRWVVAELVGGHGGRPACWATSIPIKSRPHAAAAGWCSSSELRMKKQQQPAKKVDFCGSLVARALARRCLASLDRRVQPGFTQQQRSPTGNGDPAAASRFMV